jgi:hypothetical protein
MKKFVLGSLTFLWIAFWIIFAQSTLPDSAEISVKSTINQWEATNLTITMMKNGSKMSNYMGRIYISIEDENWTTLQPNEFTLPNNWMYRFEENDLWSKEFQKWLEIKKEWIFYIKIEDMDNDDITLWTQAITVIKNIQTNKWKDIEILSPLSEETVTNNKIDILAEAKELQNSQALIYLDNNSPITTYTDSSWILQYSIWNINPWKHSLKIEIPDTIDWTILWTSNTLYFTVTTNNNLWINGITLIPETWLLLWEKTTIKVYTDEMVESVKMNLSDRNEDDSIILTKDKNWEFSHTLFLSSTWEISISLETSTANNSASQTFKDIKQISVADVPEIANITVEEDENLQTATISWDVLNWDPISWYIIKYWGNEWSNISWEEQTQKQSYKFIDVPYDTEINLAITPVRKNYLNLATHWAASKTVKFVISKPSVDSWSININEPKEPRCTVQNISTKTKKIGDNYYLTWDKVENVTKYIVYSSTSPDGSDKMKVYETSDTSYEYPFDYSAEEDKFMYFRIVWICDDWEELELTWATKVQVWPAENFFLLLCLTFLIYFWIKLFRQTEE